MMYRKKQLRGLSDENLVQMFKKKKDNVFLGELYERHLRFVFLICMKYLKNEESSRDVSMQIFEKLSDDLLRFEVKNFKAWLHIVVRNTCYMKLRADKHMIFTSVDDKNDSLNNMENSYEMHPIEKDHSELNLEQLEKAICTLDVDQKTCIELFYLKEKSYKEVTEITGYSLNQVKSHIQNGKRNLKNYLISNGDLSLFIFCLLFLMK